ncbi:hypothetical protein JXB02_04375 [Candidatus Woesearchaeota archaeon]|nr:hypothetical protein [Candidatus Woesearchaeota archaeon]
MRKGGLAGIVGAVGVWGLMGLTSPAQAQTTWIDYYDKNNKLQRVYLPQPLTETVVVEKTVEKPVIMDRDGAIAHYSGKASIDYRAGRFLEAGRNYAMVAFLEPKAGVPTLERMLDAYAKAGRIDEAVGVAKDLKERKPSTDYATWSGKIIKDINGVFFDDRYHDLREFDEVGVPALLEIADALTPQKYGSLRKDLEWMGLYLKVKQLCENKEYDEKTIKLAEQMFSINKNIYTYDQYAKLFFLKKDYQTTEKVLYEGLKMFPESFILNYSLAVVYGVQDKTKEANKLVEKLNTIR